MFARVEVAVRPEYVDSGAQGILRRIELAFPEIRKKVRWARLLDVYWLDISASREELIPALSEVCWDKVLQWVFTGNLMPAAAGKNGGLQDLMEISPYRPGKFWGIERRFRPGMADSSGRTLLEGLEIVLGKPFPQSRASSGGLLILEGPDLDEDTLSIIARKIFCNEKVETWTLVPEESLKKNDRFHQERVKYDLPKVSLRGSERIETFALSEMSDSEMEQLSRKRVWGLTLLEMQSIRENFDRTSEKEKRYLKGLGATTDVEMELLARLWSEECSQKTLKAKVELSGEVTSSIPKVIQGLLSNPIEKSWLISDREGQSLGCAFSEEDVFCYKTSAHDSFSVFDTYGGAVTGILDANRKVSGAALGARPLFNTNVICVASPENSEPRRSLEGLRHGVEQGGNKSGFPTIHGALLFDERYEKSPVAFFGSGGLFSRKANPSDEIIKKVLPHDRICMVGGGIGRDQVYGASYIGVGVQDFTPTTSVQLGDPLAQKRTLDFLLEASEAGLCRAIQETGRGGLADSIAELARVTGGASLDIAKANTKYPGLKPYEYLVSESQERMTVAVAPHHLPAFLELAERRRVEVSDLGEFNSSGRLEVYYSGRPVADLDLQWVQKGQPLLQLCTEWKKEAPQGGQTSHRGSATFQTQGGMVLLDLLSRPNIASKEWMIRQYDHEVRGLSVIKPLHTAANGTGQAWSGPNDAGVIQLKEDSEMAVAVGCGLNPKVFDLNPAWMAYAAVDEAVRNVLCVGAEFGHESSVLALFPQLSWPDPLQEPEHWGALAKACFGLQEACRELSIPLLSEKKSGNKITSPKSSPTLLMTAIARVAQMKNSRSADMKSPGDVIYLIGPGSFGLVGSELSVLFKENQEDVPVDFHLNQAGAPSWEDARRIYSWIGGAKGERQTALKSLHDVSDGGFLIAVAESLIARGLGATLRIPAEVSPWEFLFGEGFHSFVGSASESDSSALEAEWTALGIPFQKIGLVENQERLEVIQNQQTILNVGMKAIRTAWLKEGFWE